MAHIDAWDGTEIEGKAVVLNTTEGPELVAYDKLDIRADVDAVAGAVTGLEVSVAAELAALRARVEELERQLPDEGLPVPVAEPAAKTTASKAAK